MGKLKEFLSEYKNETTKKTVLRRLNMFLTWYGKSAEDLAELSPKEAKHEILLFQKAMVDKGISNNSILSYISATKNFLGSDAVGKTISFRKGQLVVQQEAEGYHNYSNGDLAAMFNVASVQYKALISLACSSGFSIAQLLKLDKDFIKAHLDRAKANNEQFVFITQIRRKKNVKALLVINPLAVEWLTKWIAQNSEQKLFTVGEDAVLVMIKKLAKRSQIKLTNKVRTHNIRAWTMSSLSKAGLNSFQIKFHVAKKIPSSDATYLRTLTEQIRELYETTDLYEKHMNILGHQNRIKTDTILNLQNALIEAEKTIATQDTRIGIMQQEILKLMTNDKDKDAFLKNMKLA